MMRVPMFWRAVGLLTVAASTLCATSTATTQVAPESVVSQALAFAESVGAGAPTTPVTSRVEFQSLHNASLYQIEWDSGQAGVRVGIDRFTGRVLSYSLSRSRRDYPVLDGSSEISSDQVETAALALAVRMGGTADWRFEAPPIRQYDPEDLSDRGDFYVRIYRFLAGAACDGDFVYASYDLFDGKLTAFKLVDYGIRVTPSGVSIPEAQARQIAKAAFVAGGGPASAETDSDPQFSPSYSWHEADPRYFRLAYDYHFDMEFELGPGVVQVTVDAVTGEVLFAYQVTGGAGGKFKSSGVKPSARRRMLLRLAEVKAPSALLRVFTAIGRTRSAEPPKGLAQWRKTVGRVVLEWTADAKKRRMYWRERGGRWSAGDLAPAEMKLLDAWVRGKPVAG